MPRLLRIGIWFVVFCSHLPFVRVTTCSVCANEANIHLNVAYYTLDVRMFEVLTLMWVGRERGMMQRRSVGGGWVEVNVHGASQSFLGLTHRMAEIRQNGRLQVLPSVIRIALLSLSHLSHAFFLSPYVLSHHHCPSLSLFFFLSRAHAHKVSLTLSCSH